MSAERPLPATSAGETTIFPQDVAVTVLPAERGAVVRESQVIALKRQLDQLNANESGIYHNIAFACVGVSSSAFLTFFGLLTANSVATWMWVAVWVSFIAPAFAAILCFVFAQRLARLFDHRKNELLESLDKLIPAGQ